MDSGRPRRSRTSIWVVVVPALLFVVGVPFLPLLISWRWGWWEAWAYAAISILGFAISRALAARRHPDLLAERARGLAQSEAKSWDRILAPLMALGGGMIPLVAGLDQRFGCSAPFTPVLKGLALLLLPGGYGLAAYALIVNAFFSGVVRIQEERGHRVVSSGPYRWIRHPGYAGALLTYVATPVLLDARWAFLPAAFVTLALMVRTYLEDRALREELEGYAAYARRVRSRVIPGVW